MHKVVKMERNYAGYCIGPASGKHDFPFDATSVKPELDLSTLVAERPKDSYRKWLRSLEPEICVSPPNLQRAMFPRNNVASRQRKAMQVTAAIRSMGVEIPLSSIALN